MRELDLPQRLPLVCAAERKSAQGHGPSHTSVDVLGYVQYYYMHKHKSFIIGLSNILTHIKDLIHLFKSIQYVTRGLVKDLQTNVLSLLVGSDCFLCV